MQYALHNGCMFGMFIILDAEWNISMYGVFREFQTRVVRKWVSGYVAFFLILENPDSLGLRKSMFLIRLF